MKEYEKPYYYYKYLLITVKFTLEFLVGFRWKSTRHLYRPVSELLTASIANIAGLAFAWKNPRPFKAVWSDQCDPFSTSEFLASKLEKTKKKEDSILHNLIYSSFILVTKHYIVLLVGICVEWFT